MGEVPLSWGDLYAYAMATEAISEPWEYRALHKMSSAYLQEKQGGEDPLRIPPMDRDRLDD